MRVYNFSAGPSTLSQEVLSSIRDNMLDYMGSGLSVTEMSHRSKVYDAIHNETIVLFRELMHIPDDYEVLFLQGGASLQFEAIPLNLLTGSAKADYIVTGNFANLAYKRAQKYGDIRLAASSEAALYTYIPKQDTYTLRDDADYVYITGNNTIFGTRYNYIPQSTAPIVCDASSYILSENIDVAKYGIVYAGAQKNIGPAGLTVVIIKRDLIGHAQAACPVMLDYKTQADANSLFNTPPTFSIYAAGETLKWLKRIGGIDAIHEQNVYKAGLLYDYIDNSSMFRNNVNPEDRSLMNIPFVTASKDLDAEFIRAAEQQGLISLKGHKLVGGMRASIYNAMPVEGVVALIDFMKKFEADHAVL